MTESSSTSNTRTDVGGIPPTSKPDRYSGIALTVVRHQGVPVAAFDGNGTVYWLNADVDHVVVDLTRYGKRGVVAAIAEVAR